MEDFPSNNPQKAKRLEASKKELKPLFTEGVSVRKKPVGKKFMATFFEGSAKEALTVAFWQVVVPKIRDTVFDSGRAALGQMVYGDQARVSQGNTHGRVNYGGAFNQTTGSQLVQQFSPALSKRGRAVHDFDEIMFDTRDKAQAILQEMYLLLESYNVVTVGEFYEICGITVNFPDEKYGWTTLQGSGVANVGGAYILNLPKPEVLKS